MERAAVEVKDGKAYDHLFPQASGETIVVKSNNASVEDTLSLITKTVAQTLEDTKKIASALKGKTLDETCSNIWHFVFNHIKYKRDERGKEQVRSPARTWENRQEGVDCDCMSEFISSILTNLEIPHKHRIAMYNSQRGWQHIYPIVPRNGNLKASLQNRKDYIVIDCVKYGYDEEEPFIKVKDYDMRLEYLNGPEDEEEQLYEVPQSTDIYDLAQASEFDDEELGKIGQWLKKTVKKTAQKAGHVVKKVGDTAGKGIRAVNKVANPATILLRNGFLLSMQANLMNVAGRLRYAYLTDEEARKKGINLAEFAKLKKIRDKAETIFWQAGGDRKNFKKAILTGKGNKDRSVPLSGLDGVEDLEDYTMMPEGEENLGAAPAAAAIAAATATVSAIAGALTQVKGLFNKNEKGQQEASDKNGIEQQNYSQEEVQAPIITNAGTSRNTSAQNILKNFKERYPNIPTSTFLPKGPETTSMIPSALPGKESSFSGSLEWVKSNPVPTLLIAAAIGGGAYLLLKKKNGGTRNGKELNGLNPRKNSKIKVSRKRGKIKVIRM